ncbi:ester cyclase [Streptomyces sp. R21]|uniref:Ester cyclase n=1 Tax=Streptomyces sp. R21 TaxID=3238627 RepID=A0AB39NZM8_9ACTN
MNTTDRTLTRNSQSAPSEQLDRNKETVRAFIDALFTKGDLGAVDEYLAEDFLNHDPPFGASADREGMRAASALIRTAFPDWHSEPDLLIAEDDLVVEHFAATGTQRGEILGVPAPAEGRSATLRGINIFRIRDERIVERWGRLDELGFMRQLGGAPAQE